jgi:hypothetical protein
MLTPLQILDKKIKIQALTNGLILGVATTLLSVASFYIITAPSISHVAFFAVPIVLQLFIPILVVLYLSFNIRKKIGGLWTFKQATTGIFIMLFAAYLINMLGDDLLFDRVIEPNAIEKLQRGAVNERIGAMKERGYSQDKIDKSLADMKKDLVDKGGFSITKFITDKVFHILFLFVIALIFASLIRNAEYIPASEK